MQAHILSTLGQKKGKKQFFFLNSFCFFLFLLFFLQGECFSSLFFSFFFSILAGSFSCSVFHLCFFFPPSSPCFILLSVFLPFFSILFVYYNFFSCYFFHPCLFSQGRCILLFLLFLFFLYLFSFLPFFLRFVFFPFFFFLLGAYGHPP